MAMEGSNKLIGGIPPSLERLTGLALTLDGKQLRFTARGKQLLKGMLAYYGSKIADVKTIGHYEAIREIAIRHAAVDLKSCSTNPGDPTVDLSTLVEDIFNPEKRVDEIFCELKPVPHLKIVPPSAGKLQGSEK